jgi:hypothetical protein
MNNQSNEIKSNNSFKALEMQDEKIKELISRYNEFKNPRTKRKLISILSPVIVNYPHFYKYLDEDFCHDFYIFILSKLDKILSKYTPFSSSKFSSWFSVTINRNLWLFIHCEKRKNKYRIEEIQADENVEKKYFVSENTVKYESDDNECYDFFNTILHSSILSEKEITECAFIIGPEGGISEAEAELCRTEGLPEITLGKRILRTETAAIAVVSAAMCLLRELE